MDPPAALLELAGSITPRTSTFEFTFLSRSLESPPIRLYEDPLAALLAAPALPLEPVVPLVLVAPGPLVIDALASMNLLALVVALDDPDVPAVPAVDPAPGAPGTRQPVTVTSRSFCPDEAAD
jgi:hypothetical protein